MADLRSRPKKPGPAAPATDAAEGRAHSVRRISGRVMAIDYMSETLDLWDATGHMTRLRFDPELHDAVDAAREQHVTVLVEDIEGVGDGPTARLLEIQVIAWARDFYKTPTLAELAKAQGWVQPTGSMMAREDLWEDGEFEEFLATVKRSRSEG